MDDWRAAAACRHHDPELFFPVGVGPSALNQAEEAKQVCRACPVREACLRWAMDDSRQVTGVWGGLTENERRSLRRRSRHRRADEKR